MIPVFKPWLTPGNIFDTNKALFRKQISGTSSFVQKFETEFSRMHENINSTAVSNGSVALDIVLQSLELKKDDEVIIPSLTIISCLAAVTRTEAKPVFCDINESSWNMKLHNIKDVVTENTKAIIAVHTYGLPCEIAEISDFCKNEGILLIEDASEAHGVEVNSKFCGTFGDFSTFSFYANKHITTGEGGALLTDSDEIYQKARQMRNLDFNSTERFKTENLYWNYRLSGLQASLGLSQIKKMKKTINLKINQGNYYTELLEDFQELFQLPLKENNGSHNHYWVYGVVLKKENIREKLMEDLLKAGIETRPFFWPLHLQPSLPKAYSNLNNDLPNSEYIGKNGLYIPLGSHVSKKMQKNIVEQLTTKAQSII